jgi:protein-S-isoprenylcysteine O-methyltransferase Ste14
VETGLYRWARHPIYTGVLLSACGVAIAHGSVAALGIALTFVPFFYYKSSYEEQLLRKIYPQYQAYSERVGRFVPRLNALKLFKFDIGDRK